MTFPIIPARTASSASYQVSRSLRFRRSAVGNLTRTFGTPTTQNTFSFSCWTKRGLLSTLQIFFGYSNLNSVYFTATDTIALTNGTTTLQSTAVYRDPSAWYHILYTQSGTTANIYVNGTLAVTGTCSVSFNTASVAHCIGSYSPASASYDGYIAEVYFVDGQVKAVSDFTATDATTGVIGPKAYTGTYGNNGFYLPFSASATSSFAGTFGGTQYLTTATNAGLGLGTSDFTIEYWMNTTVAANGATLCCAGTGTVSYDGLFGYISSGTLVTYLSSTGGSWDIASNRTILSSITTGRWYHIAFTRSGSTFRVFVDGTQVDTFTSTASLYQSGNQFTLARAQGTGIFTGLLSNVRVIKGTALYTSNFTPPVTALTAVTNTQLLTLQSSTIVDNSANALTITNTGSVTTSASMPWGNYLVGKDSSGAGNNFLPNNINATSSGTTYDSMIDSPTNYADGGNGRGNYAVLNPLDVTFGTSSVNTYSNGNLTVTGPAAQGVSLSTLQIPNGKWYFEATRGAVGTVPSAQYVGVRIGGTSAYYAADGSVGGVSGSAGASYTTNNVIGVAVDKTAGTIEFFKDNVTQGGSRTLTSYTSDNAYFIVSTYNGGVFDFNFGQRPFTYTPPSGFSALNTQNLPTPTIAAGNKYFNPVTYSGTGTTQSITGVGFSPDFVWIKTRSAVDSHALQDTIRGVQKYLASNTTDAEATQTNGLTSFDSDGFTLGGGNGWNGSSRTFVAWNWNAGGSTVSNTSGSITSQVRANPTAGFSVVTYTGTGANATVGHGLGVAPSMIIVKNRSTAGDDWTVYHISIGATNRIILNLTNASSASTVWNNTAPTSTVFSVGTVGDTNRSGSTLVAYCFAPVAGYSAFGSYTGNGSADGPMIYTGFLPRFVMIKATTNILGNWVIIDTARLTYNQNGTALYPNLSNTEVTTAYIDFLSNGFKIRNNSTNMNNTTSDTYIWAAFASNPFKTSRAF